MMYTKEKTELTELFEKNTIPVYETRLELFRQSLLKVNKTHNTK